MTKQSGTLGKFGKLLGLIGSILAIILAIADLANMSIGISTNSITSLYYISNDNIRAILSLIFGIILFMLCSNRYKINNSTILGVVIILLGLTSGYIGGLIAVIGGILIIVDNLSQ